MSFAPQLSALPASQRAVWKELRQVPRAFVLYGGTALTLRFGHRTSVDFDFFASAPIDPASVLRSLPFLQNGIIRQSSANTLTVEAFSPQPIKVSFFGLALGRVRDPELTDDGVLQVASALDVAACKMAAIQTRAESRDYVDIQALINHGITVADALGAAGAVYGGQFNPMVSLKALVSFQDGDLGTLPSALQQELREAAYAVREIPKFTRLPGGLAPDDNNKNK